jgi:hypothetical protein
MVNIYGTIKYNFEKLHTNTHNKLLNTAGIQYSNIRKDEKYELLQKNKRFKDLHKGKRCFILGNGPSLNNVNFELLADEHVFTVNSIMKVPGYEMLKSNYHVWADLAFFNLRKDINYNVKETKTNMLVFNKKNNKTECFAPIITKNFCYRNQIQQALNLNYFSPELKFSESFRQDIDYTKHTPAFRNVVQYTITLAIYMGFKEIYLLGCDTTAIRHWIDKERTLNVTDLHSYKDEKEDEKAVSNIVEKWKMKDILYDQYILFRDYDILYQYCKDRKISLVNLTEGGLLDSIPRKVLTDIIK